MTFASATTADDMARTRGLSGTLATNARSHSSAVSWGAIVAGAAAAASLSLILLILGVGLGLSSVSPWARDGVSAVTFGVSTILWLTLTQLVASAMGGYLAGRLRTRWTEVHNDEVYFRDTAHGFLAWAVASLVTAALLTSVIGSIINGGVQAGASLVSGVASTASSAGVSAAASNGATKETSGGPMGYFIDTLFRRDSADALTTVTAEAPAAREAFDRATSADTAEISRIFLNASRLEPLPAEDIRHVSQIVAQRTGLSQLAAQKRVTDVYANVQAKVRDTELAAREAADKTRKASAYSALWLFISLLIGAFVASFAATFGGRRRDA